MLSGIPPARAKKEKLIVTFAYDQNGILNVKGKIASTGKEAELEINLMNDMDLEQWSDCPLAEEYRRLIRRVERTLKHNQDNEWLKMSLVSNLRALKYDIIHDNESEALSDAEALNHWLEE
jgi:molecular chaperone DnaK